MRSPRPLLTVSPHVYKRFAGVTLVITFAASILTEGRRNDPAGANLPQREGDALAKMSQLPPAHHQPFTFGLVDKRKSLREHSLTGSTEFAPAAAAGSNEVQPVAPTLAIQNGHVSRTRLKKVNEAAARDLAEGQQIPPAAPALPH